MLKESRLPWGLSLIHKLLTAHTLIINIISIKMIIISSTSWLWPAWPVMKKGRCLPLLVSLLRSKYPSSYLRSPSISDITCACPNFSELLQQSAQFLFALYLIVHFLLPALQPSYESQSVILISFSQVSGYLETLQCGMSALSCYFPHAHLQIHSYYENQFYDIVGVNFLKVLFFEQVDNIFDGLFQTCGLEESLLDQMRLKLHGQQLLPHLLYLTFLLTHVIPTFTLHSRLIILQLYQLLLLLLILYLLLFLHQINIQYLFIQPNLINKGQKHHLSSSKHAYN